MVAITPLTTRGSRGSASYTILPSSRLAKRPATSPTIEPDISRPNGRPMADAHNLLSLSTQRHANAQFLHPLADAVGRHSKNAGDRQHCCQHSHNSQSRGSCPRREQHVAQCIIPAADRDRRRWRNAAQNPLQRSRHVARGQAGAHYQVDIALVPSEPLRHRLRTSGFRSGLSTFHSPRRQQLRTNHSLAKSDFPRLADCQTFCEQTWRSLWPHEVYVRRHAKSNCVLSTAVFPLL